MTIQLTDARVINGSVQAAGTQHTLSADFEAYLVQNGLATWVGSAPNQSGLTPVWSQTKLDGSVNLVVADGHEYAIGGAMPPGFVGYDKPTIIFVRDHAYKQIIGDATHDSMHEWFKENGLFPYSITTNTVTSDQHPDGSGASPDGSVAMTWAQLKALQDEGIEITNHACRHIGSLGRANTGVKITYTGANATATAYVAATVGTDKILHCVDSSDHTFDLSNASYDTLAELKTAVEALSGWSFVLAPELDGSEKSSNLLGVVSGNAKNCKTAGARFAMSSGLRIRYKGANLRTAYTRIRPDGSGYGRLVHLMGDGVILAEIDLSNASYDTLAEVATYINTTAFGQDKAGDWECYYMDSEGNGDSYATGVEASRFTTGGMAATGWKDCMSIYAYHHAGMPMELVWDKLLRKARDDAAAHGVTMLNFSDVGGVAPSVVFPAISEFNNFGRSTYVENTNSPFPMPVDRAFAVPGFGADDDTTSVNDERLIAAYDALADSPGFVISPFMHQLNVDGSTGKNFVPLSGSIGYQSETKVALMLAKIKELTDAKKINLLTQQQFYAMRDKLAPPSNRIFNPRFKNSGNTMTGLGSSSNGYHMPGWQIATSNVTEFSVDADDKLTITTTSASASNYMTQVVYLDPAKTYSIGMLVEVLSYSSGTGISWSLLPRLNTGSAEYRDRPNNNMGVWVDDYVTTTDKQLDATITVPFQQRKPAFIRNAYNAWDDDSALTWDLSVTKHIKLSVDGLTALEIDCSAGASSASAVRAWEIAAAINAALKASATYSKYGQYHNIARSDSGYLILEMPYPSFWSTTSNRIVVTAGTTTDATNKIFGGQASADRPIGFASPSGVQGMLHPYELTIYFNVVGRYRISGIHCNEIKGIT